MMLCDVLLQLELGKIFAEVAGYGSGQAEWPVHVVAHLTAEAFLERKDPAQLPLYRSVFGAVGKASGPRALNERGSDLPVAKELWFQARFREAGDLIREEDGVHAVSRIQRKMERRKEKEPAEVLFGMYPELAGWFESSFGEPPPKVSSKKTKKQSAP